MSKKLLNGFSAILLISLIFSVSPNGYAALGETDPRIADEQSVLETVFTSSNPEEILLNQVSQEIRDEISKAKETNPLEVLRRKIGDFSNNAKTDNRFGDQVTSPVLETSGPNNNGEFSEWQGTLKAIIGNDKIIYQLVTDEKTYYLGYEREIPGTFFGKTVRVIGILSSGNQILANSIIVVGPGSARFQAITGGLQRTAVLALRYSDIPGTPTTTAAITNVIFGLYPSVKTHWEENSYNQLTVQNIGVSGWWNMPNPEVFYNPPNNPCPPPQTGNCPLFNELVADAIIVANQNGVQFQDNDRLILYFNGIVTGGAGWGTIGYENYPAPYTPSGTISLSISWIPEGSMNVAVNAHEYGHQLEFHHSGNVYTPYDSPWDIMSNAWGVGGVCTNQGQHTIVNNKINANWLTNDVTTTANTGFLEATVYPTTRSTGLRAVEITTPNPNIYYTVEVREQELHDSCLPNEGVIIHKVDNTLSSWQAKPIDSTPGTNTLNDAQWNVGSTYYDSIYNFKIQIVSSQPNDGKLIRIGPVIPNISILNVPVINSALNIALSDPAHTNSPYILAMSFGTTPGINVGGFNIPLNYDGLFISSVFYPNSIGLNNSFGTLDSSGNATTTWNIPNIPGIVGTKVYLAFVTISPSAQILSVSNALAITLLGEFTPDANTMGLWHFNEGSGNTASDSSGNANNGNIVGATWTNGIFGNALDFDGNDYIVVPNSITLNPTGQFTVEAFYYLQYNWNPGNGHKYIVDKGVNVGNVGYRMMIHADPQISGLEAAVGGNQLSELTSQEGLTIGWHHIAYQFDGSVYKLFVDGALVDSSQSGIGALNSPYNLFIGRYWQSNIQNWIGELDEIRISNIARY